VDATILQLGRSTVVDGELEVPPHYDLYLMRVIEDVVMVKVGSSCTCIT